MQSNINFDFPKITKNWHIPWKYQRWPLNDLDVTLKTKLDLRSPNNHFYQIPWPQKIIKNGIICHSAIFHFSNMAAGGHLEFVKTLNSENRSSCQKFILRHNITRVKSKKTITVANGFKQKRPIFVQTNIHECMCVYWVYVCLCMCMCLWWHIINI